MPSIIHDVPQNSNSNVLIAPILAQEQSRNEKRIAQLSATHYGWCPYDDIELMGPLGLERRVAYDEHGNFVTRLLRSQLHVYTNVEIRQLSEKDNNIPNGPPPAIEEIVKYAGTCIGEIEDGYGEWGYMRFAPLTGLPVDQAFRVVQVIQPVLYDLATLPRELAEEAPKRIAAATAADEKFPAEIAEEVRRIMQVGARRGVIYAQTIVEELRKDIAAFVGTKQGRSSASPGDKHAFEQLREPIPSTVGVQAKSDDEVRSLLVRLAEKELAGEQPNAQEAQLAQALEAMKRQEERQAALEEEVRQLREQQKEAA